MDKRPYCTLCSLRFARPQSALTVGIFVCRGRERGLAICNSDSDKLWRTAFGIRADLAEIQFYPDHELQDDELVGLEKSLMEMFWQLTPADRMGLYMTAILLQRYQLTAEGWRAMRVYF